MSERTGPPRSSIIVGLLLAGVFFFLTFRNTSAAEVWAQLRLISPLYTLSGIAICLLTLFVRGLRWQFLLPEPARKGDFIAVQRAMCLGYGVTNVATRLGELVRIAVFTRDSGRRAASVTATVVVDRILFDFLAFVCFFAFALYGYRDKMTGLFPQLEPAFRVFLIVTLIGIAGLVAFALKPKPFMQVLRFLGLPRIHFLWSRLEPMLDQLSQGLAVCGNPGRLILVQGINILAWGLGVLYFYVTMKACGIQLGLTDTLLMFTISTFGIIIPSPGGLGTFHYFVVMGLTQLYAVTDSQAAAAATYAHGVNYFMVSLVALIFFFAGKKAGMPR